MGKDEGPLTLERSKTVDEEISGHVIDWLERNDPKKTGKPFFVLVQPGPHARHDHAVGQVLDMVGAKGGKDWGVNEAGMKQMDDNIGYVLKKLEDMGELDNTIIVFTTDNGAETHTFPDGGITPFKGQKAEHVGRWHPRSVRHPLAGRHQAGHGLERNVRVAGLGAHVRRNRRRRQGQRAEAADRRRGISWHRQNHARWRQPNRLPHGQVGDSRRATTFFYFPGSTPSAVRYKNWKFYYTMMGSTRASRLGHAARDRSTGPWSRTSCAIPSSRPSA